MTRRAARIALAEALNLWFIIRFMSAHSHNPNHPNPSELMYVKCANCGDWLDVKPGKMNAVSHGMCDTCYEKALLTLQDEECSTH